MTLKALLMGSAAAMIAVSGAKAADAVVAEPEAVEYVKVCDTYGAGFYYIPGSETCLKISGYVRVNYTYSDEDVAADADVFSIEGVAAGADAPDGAIPGSLFNAPGSTTDFYQVVTPGAPARSSTSSVDYRGSVTLDARNETDYGVLRSEFRLQGDGDASGDGNLAIDRALIHLGGLRIGYSDSFWATHAINTYGLPTAINDGYYGFSQSIFLDYTYAANGFTVTAGVEDLTGVEDAFGFSRNAEEPNLYGGISYSGSWGSVAGTVAYDALADETAYKAQASFNLFEGFVIEGFYAGDADSNNSAYVAGDGEWAWGVGANYAATDALDIYAGYGDQDGDDLQYWNVGVNYDITPGPHGLRIQGEVNVFDEYNDFRLRVQRSF